MTALFNWIKENEPVIQQNYPSIKSRITSSSNYRATAQAYINAFANSNARLAFKNLIPYKSALISQLNARIRQPRSIAQLNTPWCGPAAFFYSLASNRPDWYAQFVIDMCLYGKAIIGNLQVYGVEGFLESLPNSNIGLVDGITLGSLRHAENVLFSIGANNSLWTQLGSITAPKSVASWFRRIGCRDVTEDTNTIVGPIMDLDHLIKAQNKFSSRHSVCLLVNDTIMKSPKISPTPLSPSFFPTHWVVLNSHIQLDGRRLSVTTKAGNSSVSPAFRGLQFQAYTWGQLLHYQKDPNNFLGYYYGFVSARWP